MGEETSVKAICNTLMQHKYEGSPGSHPPKPQWNNWKSSVGCNDQTQSLDHLVNNTNIGFKQRLFHKKHELLKNCSVKFSEYF